MSHFGNLNYLGNTVAHVIDHTAFLSGLAALRFHNLIPETINYKTFSMGLWLLSKF